MMFKMMTMTDNDDGDGDDDVDDVDKNWAADGDVNEDYYFDVDEGNVVVDVGSGEDFDAHSVDDNNDYDD